MKNTAQKLKFSIKDFLSKCDQIRSFLRIWSHLLKKSLMKNFIFCAVKHATLSKMTLAVRLTISNVVQSCFSASNLICSRLRTSLNEANLDCFIQICINCPETFENSDLEKMVDILKRSHDNRRLDLPNLYSIQR